ncbi:MAG: hypothetical protein CTY39_01075 [Hyphomicrobium sp.]|nr:MAG: hypothetical protein CTY39_01075 [Hyphomicrobium sp.]
MKKCLLISPHFPPSSLAGVHRMRHLSKHLKNVGWYPIVLCVHENFHEEKLEADLARLVPDDVEVIKVAALPIEATRRLGIGDISLRARSHLRRKLFEILSEQKIDIVCITGAPYYPMLLADEIKRRHKIPVVLDFQDPWVSAWGGSQPILSKSGLSHRLATHFEPRAIRSASGITCVSQAQCEALATRYPWFDRSRMVAIPIGGDADDFLALSAQGADRAAGFLAQDRINLSYVGTIWPPVMRTLEAILSAVARVRLTHPRLYENLRFNFIGTTANSHDTTGYRVRPLADRLGISDVVYEVPQRIPYLDALATMVHSNGLLMLGSDEAHYSASKIYPVLMSGRPYLSLFMRDSSSHDILVGAGGGLAYSFQSSDAVLDIVPELADGIVRLAIEPDTFSRANTVAYAPYEAHAIAQRFAELFDTLHHKNSNRRLCA